MNRRLGICLLSLVAVVAGWSLLTVGAAADGAPGPSPIETSGADSQLAAPGEFDSTIFRIQIYQNHSARWTIEYVRPLRTKSEEQQFDRFADRFNAAETDLFANFRTRARSIVSSGSEEIDRPMNATAFERVAKRSDRPTDFSQPRGLVQLSFTWTNFAREDGNRVVVDDVFPGGMYVGPTQRLVFRRGPNLSFVKVLPGPDSMTDQSDLQASETVTWVGEEEFADQRPFAAFAPRPQVSGTDGDDGAGGTGATDGTPGQGDAGGLVPVLLVGAILLVGIAGAAAWLRGYLPPGQQSGAADTAADVPPETSAAETSSGTQSGTDESATAAAQVPEEELLSDEDRVLKLLDDNGGRMKQVAIVEETDWSKSKVSMLLSDMEEDGHISKLRLGRENIISLAGQEPDAAGSPFDDE